MEQRLRQVFAQQFKLDPTRITPDLSPEDVKGWNSLGHLGLVQAIEAEFDLIFEDGDITDMETFGKICDVLRRRGITA